MMLMSHSTVAGLPCKPRTTPGRGQLRVLSACSRPSVRTHATSGRSSGGPTGPSSGSSSYPSSTGPATPIITPGPVYTSTTGGGSGGANLGGVGGGGSGRVGTGGPGGSSGSGPNQPKLPEGWTWDRVLLTLLGIALAVPAWQYLNRRYVNKPEPEHTLAKAEDAAADIKSDIKSHTHKSTAGKVVSAVKHATVDPIKDTYNAGVQAIKHSDPARTAQHKAEDAKDSVDVASHDAASKTERGFSKAKKEVKHAVDHVLSGVDDAKSRTDAKAHETAVKGSRAVQRGKEKVDDAVYDAEAATGKATKGVLENVKAGATSVGRALHLVADSTEKGIKKAANAAERATGVNNTPSPTTSTSERTKYYYVAGGTVVGTGILAAALYYWDRKGGDLKGKVKKLHEDTKKGVDKALHRANAATEPAKPPASY